MMNGFQIGTTLKRFNKFQCLLMSVSQLPKIYSNLINNFAKQLKKYGGDQLTTSKPKMSD